MGLLVVITVTVTVTVVVGVMERKVIRRIKYLDLDACALRRAPLMLSQK
jgi:hypothetical protein